MKSIIISSVLAIGMIAVSCSKSPLAPVPVPGEGNDTPVSVTLGTTAPAIAPLALGENSAGSGTKAVIPLPEGTADAEVYDLWAIQYDATGALVGTPYYIQTLPAATAGGSGVDSVYSNVSARLTGSGGLSHTVYFIANTGSPNLFTVGLDVTTQAKLNAAMQRISAGGELAPTAAGGLLMLGTYSGVVESATPLNVSLRRLAAKVVLKFKSTLSGFTITGVQLKNAASGMYYCPVPASGSNFPAVDNTAGSESHIDYPAEDLTQAVTDGDYKKFTWYVPENLRTAVAAVPAAGDRTLDKTDGKATYIEITGVLREGDRCRKGTLQVLLGDLGAGGTDYSNFDVERNTVYTVEVDIKGLNEGDYRLSVESFDMSNSAMLSPNKVDDKVTFDIRKCLNNGFTTQAQLNAMLGASSPLTADILWQDGDVMHTSDIELDKINGLLTVKRSGTVEGNAVVALYDGSNTILWSWHIWVTGYNPNLLDDQTTPLGIATRAANEAIVVRWGQVHTYGTEFQKANGTSRVMMDRNLGATQAFFTVAGAVAAGANADRSFGLFYQWGRKDPFPRVSGSSIDKNTATGTMIPIYGPNGAALDAPSSSLSATGFRRADIKDVIGGNANTLSLSVQNPLLFIYNPNLTQSCDWYAEVRDNQNDALWGDGGPKSPYDPCPKGWRVPPAGTWNDFTRDATTPDQGTFPFYENGSVLESKPLAYATNGRLYKVTAGAGTPMTWYPASGFCGRIDGELTGVGSEGYSWSSTPNNVNAVQLCYIWVGGILGPNNGRRGHGCPVRCIQYVE